MRRNKSLVLGTLLRALGWVDTADPDTVTDLLQIGYRWQLARPGWLRNWLEFVPAWAVVQLLCWAPLPIVRWVERGAAAAAYLLLPRWRRTAARNLQIAYPEMEPEARAAILSGCYANLGRNLLVFARLPRLTPHNISDWIEYEGFDHYEQALARGKGVIFLTAHLGAWELSAAAHALYGNPMHVMVRPLDNPLLDRFVDRRRRLFGNRTLSKYDSARQALSALRENCAIGILADQNAAGDDGVFVRFFGIPASATKGVAQLAARTGATIIPGFALWNEQTERYVLKFYPPLDLESSGDRGRDVVENTQKCQRMIEEVVRRYPEQWLWIHRRWKTRPAGEPPLY